ncbi:Uncharacterised protein [Citrobacter freundii]|nr:Uncharacterised protein [Citrobacter freundii]
MPVNPKPFTISLTGSANKNVVINDAIKEIRDTLEARFGYDSTSFGAELEDNDVQFVQVKVKDMWACVNDMKLLSTFEIVVNGMLPSENLNDFIYLNTKDSVFDIRLPGGYPMIKDWLKKQLIPEKQKTGLWPDFADAVQVVYEEQVKPLLSRLSDRKSFFTMHPEDMDTRISEYGRFFRHGGNR